MAGLPDMDFTECLPADTNSSSVATTDIHRYVNPQHTDKAHHHLNDDMPSCFLREPITPGILTPEGSSRHSPPSVPDSQASSFSVSPSSSFESNCYTPPSSMSSCSSYQQSETHLAGQQYYLAIDSSSPSVRAQRLRQTIDFEYCANQEALPIDAQVLDLASQSFMTQDCEPYQNDHGTLMAVSNGASKTQSDDSIRNIQKGSMSVYQPQVRNDVSACLSLGLVNTFNTALEFGQTYQDPLQSRGSVAATSSTGLNVPRMPIEIVPTVLGSAFQYGINDYESEVKYLDDPDASDGGDVTLQYIQQNTTKIRKKKSPRRRDSTEGPFMQMSTLGHAIHSVTKSRKGGHKETWMMRYSNSDKRHECPHCDYRFNRPEHLQRHIKSRHETPKYYPCAVKDCGHEQQHKRIKSRHDNMKPHYYNTHFRYGATETGGKNRRISLKESHELGLSSEDDRWIMFLENQISPDNSIKGYLSLHKMLGYSIRETAAIRVKDITSKWKPKEETQSDSIQPGLPYDMYEHRSLPKKKQTSRWEGNDDARLSMFDWRHHYLREGKLKFDTAMDVGKGMFETEEQGILGVTMLETNEMGLRKQDVRWQRLDNGEMSIDEAVKLGVKDLYLRRLSWQSSM